MIRNLPAGAYARPPHPNDTPALVDLFNAYVRSRAAFTVESINHTWEAFDQATQSRLVEWDGTIIGYTEAWIEEPYTEAQLWAPVHPDCFSPQLMQTLIAWGEETFIEVASEKVSPDVQLTTSTFLPSDDAASIRVMEEAGYDHVRSFYRMAIDLSRATLRTPTLPSGYRLEQMQTDERSKQELFCVIDEAFRDHYGYVEQDVETAYATWHHHMIEDADFNPSYVWVVYAPDGSVAGCTFNFPRRYVGWVDTLAVLPRHRRKGIATALLYQSFEQFKTHGYKQVGLAVDADSLTGATRLYERAGMHVEHETLKFDKIHRAGADLRRTA